MSRIVAAAVTSNNSIHGTLANVNDNNPATTCQVSGENPQYFFFVMDLGSNLSVGSVQLANLFESGGPDADMQVRYSNSPLNSGNVGTSFASVGTISTTPVTVTINGFGTARYWGLTQSAGGSNWSTQTLTLGDFNLYTPEGGATILAAMI